MLRKIELDFNGEKVKFRFGLGCIGELSKRLGGFDKMFEMMRDDVIKFTPIAMDEASKYSDLREGVENVRDSQDFFDLLDGSDDMGIKNLTAFILAFSNSLTKGAPAEKVNPEDRGLKSKKKKKS